MKTKIVLKNCCGVFGVITDFIDEVLEISYDKIVYKKEWEIDKVKNDEETPLADIRKDFSWTTQVVNENSRELINELVSCLCGEISKKQPMLACAEDWVEYTETKEDGEKVKHVFVGYDEEGQIIFNLLRTLFRFETPAGFPFPKFLNMEPDDEDLKPDDFDIKYDD